MLSIAFDTAEQQAAVKQKYGIAAPMLIDVDKQVSHTVRRVAVGRTHRRAGAHLRAGGR